MMIMSTIVTIIKHVIMDFLNSNLFQTLVLIVTVVVTILIFRANKREKRKNAVTILMLQIREIEKNIEFLLSEGIISVPLKLGRLNISQIAPVLGGQVVL